jgi:hypothetical protein
MELYPVEKDRSARSCFVCLFEYVSSLCHRDTCYCGAQLGLMLDPERWGKIVCVLLMHVLMLNLDD